jgi:hypothetical protein
MGKIIISESHYVPRVPFEGALGSRYIIFLLLFLLPI